MSKPLIMTKYILYVVPIRAHKSPITNVIIDLYVVNCNKLVNSNNMEEHI